MGCTNSNGGHGGGEWRSPRSHEGKFSSKSIFLCGKSINAISCVRFFFWYEVGEMTVTSSSSSSSSASAIQKSREQSLSVMRLHFLVKDKRWYQSTQQQKCIYTDSSPAYAIKLRSTYLSLYYDY
jgi:hypothetical protein